MIHSPVGEADPSAVHLSWESVSPICYNSLPLSFLILVFQKYNVHKYKGLCQIHGDVIIAVLVYTQILKQQNQLFSSEARMTISSWWSER